jgi:DNA-directed RNA polymerase subunit RPC12/RpoP
MTRPDPATMLALASQGRKIRLRCSECGHRRILDPVDVGAAYGDRLTMEALWRRATCTRCGSRKHVILLWPGSD